MRGCLQDMVADDAANLLLNASARSDGFNEQVTVTDGSGTRSIDVVIEADQQLQADPVGDEERIERIHVFCLRDATDGMADPQLGHTLTRANESRPYVFSGDIHSSNQAAWVLVFWRLLRTGRGAR